MSLEIRTTRKRVISVRTTRLRVVQITSNGLPRMLPRNVLWQSSDHS